MCLTEMCKVVCLIPGVTLKNGTVVCSYHGHQRGSGSV